MKPPLVFLCLLSSALWLPAAFAQRVDATADKPGDEIKGAAAHAQLQANAAERDTLLEERRQALLLAQAANPDEKRRIMQELHVAQKERRAALRRNEAKVREAEKTQREEARRRGADGNPRS